MEGKRLAIDSSIWLYQVRIAPFCGKTIHMLMLRSSQFQATMRDKDGRVLVNAHVLGTSSNGSLWCIKSEYNHILT